MSSGQYSRARPGPSELLYTEGQYLGIVNQFSLFPVDFG
jgi:hypothetical protein